MTDSVFFYVNEPSAEMSAWWSVRWVTKRAVFDTFLNE